MGFLCLDISCRPYLRSILYNLLLSLSQILITDLSEPSKANLISSPVRLYPLRENLTWDRHISLINIRNSPR